MAIPMAIPMAILMTILMEMILEVAMILVRGVRRVARIDVEEVAQQVAITLVRVIVRQGAMGHVRREVNMTRCVGYATMVALAVV